ncbi:MAG: SDR family NAD(P)-dependent oxidoreductase [Paracoccaceae bacterium]|jgi:glucose 1-dehydrogenase|nr:SDR family NAD(P)-dependent oxidoreductase [Paracoccaceae bacterium]
MKLDGKSAIITGASSGLGRAMARRFAAEGAAVTIADVDNVPREGGQPTAELILTEGGIAHFTTCDVAEWTAIDALVTKHVARHGRLDIFINNAMTNRFPAKPLLETSEKHWKNVLEVNLTGAFFGCKRAVAQMIEQEIIGEVRGRIINISSQLGIRAARRNCSYGVSKAGVDYLTRSIALDYAEQHIVVNAIAPGKILTGKTGPAVAPEVIKFSEFRTPWPRLGRPNDVAGAALFLASDDASFIQGETIAVDGGWLAS